MLQNPKHSNHCDVLTQIQYCPKHPEIPPLLFVRKSVPRTMHGLALSKLEACIVQIRCDTLVHAINAFLDLNSVCGVDSVSVRT